MKPAGEIPGRAAESRAGAYLTARGLEVLAHNLRCKAGEIDLVCLDGELLVIVEVRQRAGADFGGAAASVTWRKQRKLVRATLYQWQRRPDWRARRLRFDVIAIEGAADDPKSIAWIKDAFRAVT